MTVKRILFSSGGASGGPDPFDFQDVTNIAPNTLTTSNVVTITGITGSLLVSISSGSEFSINGGAFVTSGIILNNQTLQLRTTSLSFGITKTVIVNVGEFTADWNLQPRFADIDPAPFSFTNQTGVERNTTVTSNTVTVTGLEPNYPVIITASGGFVDAGTTSLSGTFSSSKTVTTTASGTLVVAARVTSSSSFSTAVTVNVQVGSRIGTFTVTTRALDNIPDSFTFGSQSGLSTSVTATSNQITISGLEPSTSFTITASGGSVDAGTTSLSGTFSSSKTVTTTASGTLVAAARTTTSSSFNTSVVVTVSVGTGSGTFTATTRDFDQTPNDFNFPSVGGAELNTLYTSQTVTVTGLEPNASFTITASNDGGASFVAVDAGTTSLSTIFSSSKTVTTTASGTLVVAMRVRSQNLFNAQARGLCTVGTLSRVFSVTTRIPDTWVTPGQEAGVDIFPNLNTTYLSTVTATLTGIEPNQSFTLFRSSNSDINFLVDAGTTTLSGSYSQNKTFTTSSTGTFVARVQGKTSIYNMAYLVGIWRLIHNSTGIAGSEVSYWFYTGESPSNQTFGATVQSRPRFSRSTLVYRTYNNLATNNPYRIELIGTAPGKRYTFDGITYYTTDSGWNLNSTQNIGVDCLVDGPIGSVITCGIKIIPFGGLPQIFYQFLVTITIT
jgi:hypothetical protein